MGRGVPSCTGIFSLTPRSDVVGPCTERFKPAGYVLARGDPPSLGDAWGGGDPARQGDIQQTMPNILNR